MRVLLLHPEDSPRRGPWSAQRWDLVVDLGKSSLFSAAAWQEQADCRLLRSDEFRQHSEDLRMVRKLFSAGRGRLLDDEGIDWWDLTSLVIVSEAETVLVLRRLADEVSAGAELWATRAGWPANAMSILLGRPLRTFNSGRLARSTGHAVHYARLLRRFPIAQIKEIFLDKYDSGYRWRSRFASTHRTCTDPVVLLPSAYGNASRMAAAYARLLPQQPFLMIATRSSARRFVPPANVQLKDLSAYANEDPPAEETASILEKWNRLREDLYAVPEFEVLIKAGVLDRFADRFRNGLLARNAWSAVLDREPVQGVLCGDDSNLYTRLPILLAARRKLPTVDFHHGAFDGRYLLKDLPCDVYLAKNEMERDYLLRICGLPAEKVVIGAPASGFVVHGEGRKQPENTSVIFFSEPYEVAGMRAEEVYREILPPLWRLARAHGRGLIVKLHPFESRSQRYRIVRDIVPSEGGRSVSVVDGPLTDELMSQAWFGVTVESTSVMDCLQRDIACFLCEWLAHSPYEYVRQYARFGVGEILRNAEEVGGIPDRLADLKSRPLMQPSLATSADPAMLQQWLTSGWRERSGARSAS